MSANPKMTLNQLRETLNNIPAKYGNCAVTVWLPGSRVDLHQVMLAGKPMPIKGSDDTEILIEGNLREGSALS